MEVQVTKLITESDRLFIYVGGIYKVKKPITIKDKVIGYTIATKRNEWAVTLDQVKTNNIFN